MQPGETITPGAGQPEPQNETAPQQPAVPQPASYQPVQPQSAAIPPQAQNLTDRAPLPQPQPTQQPATEAITDQRPETEEPEEVSAMESTWQFSATDDDYSGQAAPQPQSAHPVNWTASEYVAHDKNPGWYLMVVLGSVVIALIVYVVTRDYVSPAVMIVLGIAFAAFGARKPQVLEYGVDNGGVHIGQKSYPYGMFRTFSVLEEDAIRSILLMPLQRFNLPISIYYDPMDEQRIVEALSLHLPHEDRQVGPIDNLMRKIRF